MKSEKFESGEKFLSQLLGVRHYVESRVESGEVSLHIHLLADYEGNPKISMTVCNQKYGDMEIEVKGIDLEELMDEFNRRSGWQERQARIALPSPIQMEKEDDEEMSF